MAERLSTTSLLRIKTPKQMSSSDQYRRIKARTRPCLRKREKNSSRDLTSYSSLSTQPINDFVTSLWLSTHSLLDSSSEDRGISTEKCASVSGLFQQHSSCYPLDEHKQHQQLVQRQEHPHQQQNQLKHHLSHLVSSTPKHPSSLSRASRSVPNLASRKPPAFYTSTDPLIQKSAICSVDSHQTPQTKANFSTRSESYVRRVSSKKRSSQKNRLRSFSTLSRCIIGEDTDLERSFEEFCRTKQLTKATKALVSHEHVARPDGEVAVKSGDRLTSTVNVVHASKSDLTNIDALDTNTRNAFPANTGTSADAVSSKSNVNITISVQRNHSDSNDYRGRNSTIKCAGKIAKSAQGKSRSEIVLPLLKPMLSSGRCTSSLSVRNGSNSSDLYLYGRCDSHVQNISFNDSCDSVEDTRPLDQSMSDFIQTADIDNLASLAVFFDKVVNKPKSRVTLV